MTAAKRPRRLAKATNTARTAELRQNLMARRHEVELGVRGRILEGLNGQPDDTRESLELSEQDHQADIELTLLQMRAEMVTHIDQALARLETGQYGSCAECGDEISEPRLRALPFAVRCQPCEGTREEQHRSSKQLAARRGLPSLNSEGAL